MKGMEGLVPGAPAPDFALPDTAGRVVRLAEFRGARGFLVAFLCESCPLARLIRPRLAELCREYQKRGVAVVAVNPNLGTKPGEDLAAMRATAENGKFAFPYLADETQEMARACGAVCTPELFLFDADFRLFYHGQFDAARPNKQIPVTGEDLRNALEALLAGHPAPMPQNPAVGCSIRWKKENIG